MTLTAQIPSSVGTDSGDVTEALDIATTLWKQGNPQDAIRWVRRAAQAADDAGDTMRMTALASAGADLEQSLTAPKPAPAAARPGSSADLADIEEPPASAAPRSSTPPPLPPRARPSKAPPAPSAGASSASTAPPPPQPPRPGPVSVIPPNPRVTPPSMRAATPSPAPVAPETPARIRVAIEASPSDPSFLVVRRLGEGAPPPEGWREGWLEGSQLPWA